MTRKYQLVAALLLCSAAGIQATAQETGPRTCTPETIRDLPGRWTQVENVIVQPVIPKTELPALLKKMEGLADLLRRAIQEPAGFDAKWYRSVRGKPELANGPQEYALWAPLYRLSCRNGLAETAHEYGDQLSIMANDTWTMSGIGRFDIGGKSARLLGSPIGELRGYPLFEPEYSSPFSGAVNNYQWVVLVAKPGQSPFRWITRQELLEHLRSVNEKKRSESMALVEQINKIRPRDVQDAEKEKELARYIQGAKDERQRQNWTERFQRDYRTDEQKREEALAKTNSNFDKIRTNLDQLSAKYPGDRQREPALVDGMTEGFAPTERFDFVPAKPDRHICSLRNCRGGHGKPLAVLNEKYFDSSLSRAAAQYFTVTFRWQAARTDQYRDAKFEQLRDEFFARFDFDRLAGMLGK